MTAFFHGGTSIFPGNIFIYIIEKWGRNERFDPVFCYENVNNLTHQKAWNK